MSNSMIATSPRQTPLQIAMRLSRERETTTTTTTTMSIRANRDVDCVTMRAIEPAIATSTRANVDATKILKMW